MGPSSSVVSELHYTLNSNIHVTDVVPQSGKGCTNSGQVLPAWAESKHQLFGVRGFFVGLPDIFSTNCRPWLKPSVWPPGTEQFRNTTLQTPPFVPAVVPLLCQKESMRCYQTSMGLARRKERGDTWTRGSPEGLSACSQTNNSTVPF